MEKAPLTQKIQHWLLMADIPLDARIYVTAVGVALLALSLVLSVLGMPAHICALIYLILLLVALYLPRTLARWRAELAEAELPYALMTIASLVDAGVNFPTALASVSGDTVLGRAFRHVLDIYNRGVPMERALRRVGNSFLSQEIKRAFDHLAVLYHSGAETTVIKRMAEDQIRIQGYEAKRFTAKLAMYTLVYIAIAALVPSLYVMYVILSSFALGAEVSPEDVYLMVFAVFPTVTAVTLAFMYAKTPAFMRG